MFHKLTIIFSCLAPSIAYTADSSFEKSEQRESKRLRVSVDRSKALPNVLWNEVYKMIWKKERANFAATSRVHRKIADEAETSLQVWEHRSRDLLQSTVKEFPKRFRSLRHLDLKGTFVTASDLETVAGLTYLDTLVLGNNWELDDTLQVQKALEKFSQLRKFEYVGRRFHSIGLEFLRGLAVHLPNLSVLDLRARWIPAEEGSEDGQMEVDQSNGKIIFPKLQTLYVPHKITIEGLANFEMPELVEIGTEGVWEIPEFSHALCAAIASFPKLVTIPFSSHSVQGARPTLEACAGRYPRSPFFAIQKLYNYQTWSFFKERAWLDRVILDIALLPHFKEVLNTAIVLANEGNFSLLNEIRGGLSLHIDLSSKTESPVEAKREYLTRRLDLYRDLAEQMPRSYKQTILEDSLQFLAAFPHGDREIVSDEISAVIAKYLEEYIESYKTRTRKGMEFVLQVLSGLERVDFSLLEKVREVIKSDILSVDGPAGTHYLKGLLWLQRITEDSIVERERVVDRIYTSHYGINIGSDLHEEAEAASGEGYPRIAAKLWELVDLGVGVEFDISRLRKTGEQLSKAGRFVDAAGCFLRAAEISEAFDRDKLNIWSLQFQAAEAYSKVGDEKKVRTIVEPIREYLQRTWFPCLSRSLKSQGRRLLENFDSR